MLLMKPQKPMKPNKRYPKSLTPSPTVAIDRLVLGRNILLVFLEYRVGDGYFALRGIHVMRSS